MIEVEKNRIQVEVMTKMDEIKSGYQQKESFLSRFLRPFESTKPQKNKLKVLICEDSEILCKIISKIMEKKGFDVTATETPTHFLTKERLADFDFIITDNNMPYMMGTQFTEYVEKELKLELPMYLYSGDPDLKNEWPLTKVRRGIFEKGSGFEAVLQKILTDFNSYKDEMNAKLEMKLAITANTLMA